MIANALRVSTTSGAPSTVASSGPRTRIAMPVAVVGIDATVVPRSGTS